MADLNELTSSMSVKILGSSSTGVESTPVSSTANGDLNVIQYMNVSAVATALTVTTTAVEMKVGGANLVYRKLIVIEAQAAGYTWGISSGSQPFSLPNGTALTLQLGPNISIWVKKASGTGTVAVAEFS